MNKKIIQILLKRLVGDLVYKKYDKIVSDRRNGSLTIEEIDRALREYPGNITMPPEETFSDFHMYDHLRTQGDSSCTVEFDLWYDSKQSDLTLSAEIVEENRREYGIRIENIHVL